MIVAGEVSGLYNIILFFPRFMPFPVFEDDHSLMEWSDDAWSGWFGWNVGIRQVSCIIVKRRSRDTRNRMWGHFLL